ncbi:MAG TPA: O-antigen ligase family protein [Terracidiphilus sp.]|nr:O-antigen ligase family protein [Terracidiphilus sp.]
MTYLVSNPCTDSSPQVHAPFSVIAFSTGFYFAARTIFVFVAARWLSIGTEPGVLAGFACAAFLTLVAAFNAFGPARVSGGLFKIRPLAWVLVYLMFSGCSLLWSASSASSVLYWAALVSDVGMVLLLAQCMPAAQLAHSLFKGFITASCALAVVAWIMPAAEDLRLGDIDYFNTNQIGSLCALSFLMCLLLASRNDAPIRPVPWFLGVTLIRSLSKSTLVALLVCMVYRMLSDHAVSRSRRRIISITAILLALAFWSLFSAYYDVYTSAGNQAETLTGRTAIWAWTLDAALVHPWFGNGFDAMWRTAPPFGGELFQARHAENELLQQFFAYGVCGVVLLAGIYGSIYRLFRQLPHSSARSALIAFVVYALVRGLTEAEPFDLLLPLWLVAALSLLAAPRAVQLAPTLSEPAQTLDTKALSAC